MRSRDTSRETWQEILDSGNLGPSHRRIYEMVARYPDKTANEIYRLMVAAGMVRREDMRQKHSRFTELRDMGCIEEVRRRRCSTSNKPAATWQITGKPPIPNWRQVVKGIGRRPIEDKVLDLKQRIRELEAENVKLKAEVAVWKNKRTAVRRPMRREQMRLL